MGCCHSSTPNPHSSSAHDGTKRNSDSKAENDTAGSNGRGSSAAIPGTSQEKGQILHSPDLKIFSFSELKLATRNFSADHFLGSGGFGYVYKGWIDDRSLTAATPETGTAVAVKRLIQYSLQGQQEWLVEIKNLGQLRHPNIIKLIGYCMEDHEKLLVYEFMPNGSLDKHLYGRDPSAPPLSWDVRMNIALGAAKGLMFLHNEARLIYRDFKSSDIMLDSSFNPKISDFGVVKDGPTDSKTHVSTRVLGTPGYAAHEYMQTGHLSTKTDVYGFGAVLLEIISGRRIMNENESEGKENLISWARPYLVDRRRFFEVFDPCIEGQFSGSYLLKVAAVLNRCLSLSRNLRPDMEEVVKLLEQLLVPEEKIGHSKFQSNGIRNSIEQSQVVG